MNLDAEILLSYEDDDQLDSESAKSFEFYEYLLEVIESVAARIEAVETSTGKADGSQVSFLTNAERSQASVKLPKLPMTHFNGDALKWQ